MTRFRLVVATLAILLAVVAVRLAWTASHRDENDGSASNAAAHGARVAAQLGTRTTSVPVDVPIHVPPAAPAPVYRTVVETRFAASGASPAEIAVMKTSFPDWETRFAGASDDMLKAYVTRVKPHVPVTIVNEVSHVAAVDIDAAVAQSMSRNAAPMFDDVAIGAGALDDVAVGGAGVLDDVGRVAGGGAGVLDDVARGAGKSAGMLDDVLRVLGLGGAAAGAAAAAASKKGKKK